MITAVAVSRPVRGGSGSGSGGVISAISTVFSDFSAFNQARAIPETTSHVHAQIKAIYDAILAAYNASNHMKFHGCKSVVIMIDTEMEWLARVLCRYNDLHERANYDELKLREYFLYPELITQLNNLIVGFEGTTMLRVQFWPVQGEELGMAYGLVNKALDLYLSPVSASSSAAGSLCYYDDDGVLGMGMEEEFDASDYGSVEDEDLIDSINCYGGYGEEEDDGFVAGYLDADEDEDVVVKVKGADLVDDVEVQVKLVPQQQLLQDQDEIVGVEPGFALVPGLVPGNGDEEDSGAGTLPVIISTTNANVDNASTTNTNITTPITPPQPIPALVPATPVASSTATTSATLTPNSVAVPLISDLHEPEPEQNMKPLALPSIPTTPPNAQLQPQSRHHEAAILDSEPEPLHHRIPEMQQIKPLRIAKKVNHTTTTTTTTTTTSPSFNPIASILATFPLPTASAAAKSLVNLNLHKTWLLPEFSFEKEVGELDLDMNIGIENMGLGTGMPLSIPDVGSGDGELGLDQHHVTPPPRLHIQKDKPKDNDLPPSKIPKLKQPQQQRSSSLITTTPSTFALLPSPMPRPSSNSPAAAALSLCGVLAQAVSSMSIGELGIGMGMGKNKNGRGVNLGGGRLGRLGLGIH